MFGIEKNKKIKDYLLTLGADNISHVKGKTLYDHLLRVGSLLDSWGLEDDVIAAGLCHSLYSTESFKTVILTIDKREILKKIIGERAEELVYLYCQIKRDSLILREGDYFFESYIDNRFVPVTETQASQLVHISIVNQIDHLSLFNVPSMSSYFGTYLKWSHLLCDKANSYLENIGINQKIENNINSVRFIAHAGIHITSNLARIAIDPWLYPSSRTQPKLQGLDPESFTIDYLIPEPKNIIQDISSDIILLSHFHTHHSPFQEIKELITMNELDIVCPSLSEEKLTLLKENLGESLFKKITFHFLTEDTQLEIRGIRIKCLTHSHKNHFAYFVQTEQTSVLHIADAAASKDSTSLLFEDFWKKFYGLKPKFLFMSAGGHKLRTINEQGERNILENTTMTPTQAAKLTVNIKAAHAGIIGVHNFSVWDKRLEYSNKYEALESEFYWALSFLAPTVKVHQLRPGDIFLCD